jgi:hypothetical protein
VNLTWNTLTILSLIAYFDICIGCRFDLVPVNLSTFCLLRSCTTICNMIASLLFPNLHANIFQPFLVLFLFRCVFSMLHVRVSHACHFIYAYHDCMYLMHLCSILFQKPGSFFYSVAEPHHFYAAPAPGKNFDAAPAALAPAPTLLYSKAKFLKRTKFSIHVETTVSFFI